MLYLFSPLLSLLFFFTVAILTATVVDPSAAPSAAATATTNCWGGYLICELLRLSAAHLMSGYCICFFCHYQSWCKTFGQAYIVVANCWLCCYFLIYSLSINVLMMQATVVERYPFWLIKNWERGGENHRLWKEITREERRQILLWHTIIKMLLRWMLAWTKKFVVAWCLQCGNP